MNKVDVLWFVFSGRMNDHTWGNNEVRQHMTEGDPEEIWRQICMQRRRFFPCDQNPNKEIQGSIVKFVIKCFKLNIFSKDKMEMHMEHNLSLSTQKGIHISNLREKENPNLAWRNLFQVKEDYCRIIVN